MKRKIDWEAGNGILLYMLALIIIIMYMFGLVIETGGWYYTTAWAQTKTDAIIEGASVMADSGYVAADKDDPKRPSKKRDKTEIDIKAASEMAEALFRANSNHKTGLIEEFNYIDNTNQRGDFGNYGMGVGLLSYNQRVYCGIGTISSHNFFNLVPQHTYDVSANGKVLVTGIELPLQDSVRFAEMYPDDPRVPISALTSNTGTDILNAFTAVEVNDTLQKGSLITGKNNDQRSAALYNAVLDQFKLDSVGKHNGSKRYSNTQTYGAYSDDYVYSKNASSVKMSPSKTLLWDISVAMNCEVPRYTKKTNSSVSQDSFYNWYKGRKDVVLTDININDTTHFGTLGSVKEALDSANRGHITFAQKGNVYYFIRPTATDGSGSSSTNITNKVSCIYTDGTNGSSDALVDISGAKLYYVKG